MDKQSFEAITHPVRIRILSALNQLGEATTREISATCPDIPTATLYRHIALLQKQDILAVERENRVNGIIEKVYRLPADLLSEAENTPPRQLMGLLFQFLMTSFGDFQTYLSTLPEDPGPINDCGFRYEFLNLTPEEFEGFITDLNRCMAPYINKEPSPERRLWRFSTITVPLKKE